MSRRRGLRRKHWPGAGVKRAPTCDGVGLGVLLAERGVAQIAQVLKRAPDIQVGHQAGDGRRGHVASLQGRGRGPVWAGEGYTYVHWQRYPCRGSLPALVRTVLGSWGPQGAAGNTLKRLCSSAGDRAPSRSCGQRGGSDRSSGGHGGAAGAQRPHLVVLLKHPLHKLVTSVVELGAAARGHTEPVGAGWGCAQLPGTAGHFLPTQAGHTANPPTQRKTCQEPPTQDPGAPCPIRHRAEVSPEPECHSRWAEVISCQLQRVSIAKAPQDGPRGLVAASLDEERVQEKEACSGVQRMEWHRTQPGLAHPRSPGRKGVRPHRPGLAGHPAHLPPRSCSPPSSRPPGPAGPAGVRSRTSVSKRKQLLVRDPLPLSQGWPRSGGPLLPGGMGGAGRQAGPHLEGVELLVTECLVHVLV